MRARRSLRPRKFIYLHRREPIVAENSEVEKSSLIKAFLIVAFAMAVTFVITNALPRHQAKKPAHTPTTLNLAYGVWPKHIKVYGVHLVVSGMYVTCLSQKCEDLFHTKR